MRRTTSTRIKATATLALTCATALVFAVTTVQARPTRSAGSQAATAAKSKCTIAISGAPWRIRAAGTLSGDQYTLAAENMSCSSARTWVAAVTHRHGTALGQTFNGSPGFNCKSFSTPASGDKLLYSGACMRGPHNVPFFGWGPKVPGH
jgi:hypothetical protein